MQKNTIPTQIESTQPPSIAKKTKKQKFKKKLVLDLHLTRQQSNDLFEFLKSNNINIASYLDYKTKSLKDVESFMFFADYKHYRSSFLYAHAPKEVKKYCYVVVDDER